MGKRPHDADESSPEYEELVRTVAARIKQARQAAGLTQSKLGEKAGFTQAYIFEMETGGANLTLKTLSKMAVVLNMDARDLLPESRRAPLSSTSLDRLHSVLERTATAMSARQAQEAEWLAELHSLTELRFAIERSVAGGYGENHKPASRPDAASLAAQKKSSR